MDCKRCFGSDYPISGKFGPRAHPRTQRRHIAALVQCSALGESWLSLCGAIWFEAAPPAPPPEYTCVPRGRVFVLTGPQMLELAEMCENVMYLTRVAPKMSTVSAEDAMRWYSYLHREHAAHFGDEKEASDG